MNSQRYELSKDGKVVGEMTCHSKKAITIVITDDNIKICDVVNCGMKMKGAVK